MIREIADFFGLKTVLDFYTDLSEKNRNRLEIITFSLLLGFIFGIFGFSHSSKSFSIVDGSIKGPSNFFILLNTLKFFFGGSIGLIVIFLFFSKDEYWSSLTEFEQLWKKGWDAGSNRNYQEALGKAQELLTNALTRQTNKYRLARLHDVLDVVCLGYPRDAEPSQLQKEFFEFGCTVVKEIEKINGHKINVEFYGTYPHEEVLRQRIREQKKKIAEEKAARRRAKEEEQERKRRAEEAAAARRRHAYEQAIQTNSAVQRALQLLELPKLDWKFGTAKFRAWHLEEIAKKGLQKLEREPRIEEITSAISVLEDIHQKYPDFT